MADPNEADPQSRPATTLDLERIRALNRRANGGDAEALAELRNLLEANPRVWKQVGDLQKHAELALIRLASGGDALAGESMHRTVAALKRELAGESPSPIERLLVDQIAAVHVELTHLAADAARAGGTPGQASVRIKRLESATRRYHAALKQLATIRALVPRDHVPGLRVVGAGRHRA